MTATAAAPAERFCFECGKPIRMNAEICPACGVRQPMVVRGEPNRLYRDVANGKIGGVCAGLAEFLNIDVTIVRVLFILAIFAGGLGLVAYIILWLVVPVKPLIPAPSAVVRP